MILESTGTGASKKSNLQAIINKRAPSVRLLASDALSLVESYIKGVENIAQSEEILDLGTEIIPVAHKNPISYEDAKGAMIIASNMMDTYSFWMVPENSKADELFSRYMQAHKSFGNLVKPISNS